MTIEPEGEFLVLRIKHFHPRLIGWEEKEQSREFVLVQLSQQDALFLQRNVVNPPWMSYRLESNQTLVSYFELKDEVVADSDKFIYTRL